MGEHISNGMNIIDGTVTCLLCPARQLLVLQASDAEVTEANYGIAGHLEGICRGARSGGA